MSDSVFRADGGHYLASEDARGPWDPQAMHGGAPAALIATLFEQMEHAPQLRVARLGFELLRPIPFEPLTVATHLLRDGRRVQELAAELSADGRPICRASALRVQEVPAALPAAPGSTGAAGSRAERAMPGPDEAREVPFTLDHSAGTRSFGAAMEMRWLDDPGALGPARVWMRLRPPLLDGARASSLASLVAVADFGNGVSAALPFDGYVFINADLSIHLHREPRGEWIGLDARTLLPDGGSGTAECVLHDVDGPIGRSFQALVVQAR
jgi:hypothetical protein